jgi:nicotinamide mononucleotide transporter
LFYCTKLYSEAILYFYYIIIGFYGWHVWTKSSDKESVVKQAGGLFHTIIISIGIVGSLALGFFFKTQTDAARSFADAFSTIFSFIASYLEVHRILSAWYFWMLINIFSVWLYYDRGLIIYAALMGLYFSLSIYGYLQWRKLLKVQ